MVYSHYNVADKPQSSFHSTACVNVLQDYWTHWETFKILTETTRHPEYLLVATSIDDYRFLDMAEWLRCDLIIP